MPPEPAPSPAAPPVALVTGSARRIGRAIALELARHGWAVGVHYRHSRTEAEAVVAEICDLGGSACALQADLSQESESSSLIPRLKAQLGSVRLLVNNASEFMRDEALTVTRASWDHHMAVNLRAPFVLAQAMAQDLFSAPPAAPPAHGVIVNMIDQRVWALTPHFTSYTISKAALWTLTQTLALAFAPRIRVNAIGPGPTLPSIHQTAQQFAAQVANLPLAQPPTAAEIAHAILFILSQPALTGQMLALDSGQHLGWAMPGTANAPQD